MDKKKKKEKAPFEMNESELREKLSKMVGSKRAEALVLLVNFNARFKSKKLLLIHCLELAESMKKRYKSRNQLAFSS